MAKSATATSAATKSTTRTRGRTPPAAPPYYERYQEEREKRYASDLRRVDEAIGVNRQKIDELKVRMDEVGTALSRRIDEVRETLNRRIDQVDRRIDDLASTVKWGHGLIFTGIIAIIVKMFLK